DRRRYVVVTVRVDQDLDLGADRLAHGRDAGDAELLAGGADLPRQVPGVIRDHLVKRIELEGDVAPGHDSTRGRRVVRGRPTGGVAVQRGEPAVRVQWNIVADLAPEEIVHGPARDLAFDVPECNVDPAHHGR